MNPNASLELCIDAAAACEIIRVAYQMLFPGRQCSAKIRNVIGDFIDIRINMLEIGEKPLYGIDMNAPGYMVFMINMSNDFGQPLKMGAPGFDLQGQATAGLKFRKMKASTPSEAAEKFARWLEKNADEIRTMAK